MAHFQSGNARIYYEDVGSGEAIISNHGLAEDTSYWGATGVTTALAEKYRVVSMDMRGHGRTEMLGEPYGYDEVTMGADFDALADHLGIGKFHMLSHATGGMLAARYGIRHSDRLLSLMLTDTGSETQPRMYHPDGREISDEDRQQAIEAARQAAERPSPPPALSYEERRAAWYANPGVFTFKMAEHPDADELFNVLDGFGQHRVDPEALAKFRQSFYSDPDPMAERLKDVGCPTLVLLGEADIVFIKPSELMASEIPDVRHVLMPNVGHMTAIENAAGTIRELLDFLDCVAETGHANR
ncbi:MAG: alpha/beta hydrolase [Dehalococcoidales bacterium]